MDSLVLIAGVLAAGIRLATPIALAALGETVGQRAGVINVGVEGIMLVGAMIAVLFSVLSGSPWVGLLAAIVAGVILASVHAYFTVVLKLDQIVCGIAMLFLGAGISGTVFRLTLATGGSAVQVPGFSPLDLFGLGRVPVIGPLLFGHHALVYLTGASAVLLLYLFRRTRLGLMARAVGESPIAANAMGIGVDRLRFLAVMVGGGFAAAGGAFLSTAALWGFVENMTAGRGFLAIACVVFARWNPLGAVLIALVFGIADAVQIRLQSVYPGIPYQWFTIVPYLVALVSLAFASRNSSMPAALGIPFRKR
jgi:ABC-type uncharacterized transport system permease subunit